MEHKTTKQLADIAVTAYKTLLSQALTPMEITIIIALLHNLDGISDTVGQIEEKTNDSD